MKYVYFVNIKIVTISKQSQLSHLVHLHREHRGAETVETPLKVKSDKENAF